MRDTDLPSRRESSPLLHSLPPHVACFVHSLSLGLGFESSCDLECNVNMCILSGLLPHSMRCNVNMCIWSCLKRWHELDYTSTTTLGAVVPAATVVAPRRERRKPAKSTHLVNLCSRFGLPPRCRRSSHSHEGWRAIFRIEPEKKSRPRSCSRSSSRRVSSR